MVTLVSSDVTNAFAVNNCIVVIFVIIFGISLLVLLFLVVLFVQVTTSNKKALLTPGSARDSCATS